MIGHNTMNISKCSQLFRSHCRICQTKMEPSGNGNLQDNNDYFEPCCMTHSLSLRIELQSNGVALSLALATKCRLFKVVATLYDLRFDSGSRRVKS